MKYKRAIRKALVVLCLVCLLFFNLVTVPVHAIAGELVVGGAAVMSIGLVGVLGMLSMNTAGFSDALYQAASDANQDIREFATALFTSYARTQNITAGQAVNLAAQGTSYLEDGTIIFNKAMSDMMSGFINWAWSEDGGGIINYASPVASNGYVDISSVDKSVLNNPTFDYQLYVDSDYVEVIRSWSGREYKNYQSVVSGSAYGLYLTTNNQVVLISDSSFSYSTDGSNILSADYIGSLGGVSCYRSTPIQQTSNFVSSIPSSASSVPGTFYNNSTALDVAYLLYNGVPGDVSYDVNLDVLDNIQNDSDVNLLNPNDFITVSDAPVGGGTINIEDWLNALADVSVGQMASLPVEADGVITEAVGELAGTDDIAVTQDAVQVGSQAVADSTSVSGLDEFTLDLTDFFPFCIPFDIYDMLSLFASSREAPHFDYRFYVPGVCDEIISIDLSAFDQAAQVLRSVELLASAIGLAFVTKKLIQGGD